MIRLATVFSGIGAIEHALDRMGIEHEIVFACDNGDVDILTKKININFDEIRDELLQLQTTIDKIHSNKNIDALYKNQLKSMLSESINEFNEIDQLLDKQEFFTKSTFDLLRSISNEDSVKSNRKKEYLSFLSQINNGSDNQKKLLEMQIILKLHNDLKKDNKINDYNEIEEFYSYLELNNGKKTIHKIQDLSQRASQLHEKINYLKVQNTLDTFGEDWTARKKYIDSLYKGLEKRNQVRKSYLANYDLSEEDFHWNVAFLNGKQYEGQVDLFVGGSPCQSFSLVGKQRGLDDTRGTLFYEYARLIDEIKPKIFIYENVKALTSHDNGKTWKKMQEVFTELGYRFSWSILNSKNYGIPQNRERVFVVGFRNDLLLEHDFKFPTPIPLEKKMQDFLIDNAPGGYFLPKKGVEFVTLEKNLSKKYTQIDGEIQLCQKKNQQFNWHGDFVFQSEKDAQSKNIPNLEKYFLSEKVKKYVLSSGTKNFYSRPKVDLEIARPLLTSMHKMHRAGVDNYVTTEGRLRKLTPRECLRLMGFSDKFKIVVSDTSMYQQSGNSIVVDVLIALMNSIISAYPDLI